MADNSPEVLWEQLLSRQAELVRQAFLSLSPSEQEAVLTHLKLMSAEDAIEAGWHVEQQISARNALDALEKPADPKSSSHSS